MQKDKRNKNKKIKKVKKNNYLSAILLLFLVFLSDENANNLWLHSMKGPLLESEVILYQ